MHDDDDGDDEDSGGRDCRVNEFVPTVVHSLLFEPLPNECPLAFRFSAGKKLLADDDCFTTAS